MTTKNKLFAALFLLANFFGFAQAEGFQYQRKLENPSAVWHKIILPDAALAKMNSDFSDIRIVGDNGSVEAPFLLKKSESQISETEIPFKMINVSSKNSEYFYTFELSQAKQINQIKLNFEQENFDWRVDLEASNNQVEWFSVVENARILSIKNNQTDYQFTQINFPDSKFQFYRIKIKSEEQPELIEAKIWELKKNEALLNDAKIIGQKTEIDAQKNTVIFLEIANTAAIASVNLQVGNRFDYYRPIKIEVLKDSVRTEKGWHFNYETIANETLSSLDKNAFLTGNTFGKKLKITIENGNNQPLKIEKVSVKTAVYYLLARFTEKANYSLFYGNKKASQPHYDIENFEQNIPKNITTLQLQNEQLNNNYSVVSQSVLFENKIWLWILMGIIIIVIGYFSLKMLRE